MSAPLLTVQGGGKKDEAPSSMDAEDVDYTKIEPLIMDPVGDVEDELDTLRVLL